MAAEKRSREARREQIAEAALEVIARHGTRSLSVRAVARRIGIVPSAIYRHFHGKEEILSAAIEQMGERLLENAARAAAGKGGTIQRLRMLLQDHVRAIALIDGCGQNHGKPNLRSPGARKGCDYDVPWRQASSRSRSSKPDKDARRASWRSSWVHVSDHSTLLLPASSRSRVVQVIT